MEAKRSWEMKLRGVGWNTLMGAIVYLPVFLLGVMIQTTLQYDEEFLGPQLGYAIIYYLPVFLMVVLPGTVVHSVTLMMFVSREWPQDRCQVVVFVSSLLLPGTFLLMLPPGSPFSVATYVVPTILATMAYGYWARCP